VRVLGRDGRTVERRVTRIEWDPIRAEKGGKKQVQSREEMSSAASDLLRRMMRRPK